MKVTSWVAAAGLSIIGGCGALTGGDTYTLYRNSPTDPAMRVHWATFDADESGDYNGENCQMAVDLLTDNLKRLNGDGYAPVRFWCEKGTYRA